MRTLISTLFFFALNAAAQPNVNSAKVLPSLKSEIVENARRAVENNIFLLMQSELAANGFRLESESLEFSNEDEGGDNLNYQYYYIATYRHDNEVLFLLVGGKTQLDGDTALETTVKTSAISHVRDLEILNVR